jgi:glutathione synthase/RimK-type ligase-like ATP-grasp enzyme
MIADQTYGDNAAFFAADRRHSDDSVSVRRYETASKPKTAKARFSPGTMQQFRIPDADAGLLRIYPPLKSAFLSAVAHGLAHKPIINAPSGLMQLKSRDFLMNLADHGVPAHYMMPMALCHTAEDCEHFAQYHGNSVLKAVESYGGLGVARYMPYDIDIRSMSASLPATLRHSGDIESWLGQHGPCLAMPYMQAAIPREKRIELIGDTVLSVRERFQLRRDWRCNLGQKAWTLPTRLNSNERNLLAALAPVMRSHGASIWGVDLLRDSHGTPVISDLNVCNLQLARSYERLIGPDPVRKAADGIFRLCSGATRPSVSAPRL